MAELLRDADTRAQALQALERTEESIEPALALAVAPALAELLGMNAAQLGQGEFDSASLLLARLFMEASDHLGSLYAATFCDGRLQAVYGEHGTLAQIARKPAAEVTLADAHTMACWQAHHATSQVRGWTVLASGLGLAPKTWSSFFMGDASVFSKARMTDDETVARLILLMVELLKTSGTSGLVAAGVPLGIREACLVRTGSQIAQIVLQVDIFGLYTAELRNAGKPADWVTISKGKRGSVRGSAAVNGAMGIFKNFVGQSERPDLEGCVASGMFEACVEAVKAVAASGVNGLRDTDHTALASALGVMRNCCKQPGCEERIRSVAHQLAFCLEHDLDWVSDLGYSTSAFCAQVCCSIFGGDEGESDFTFSQHLVDQLITKWSVCVRGEDGLGATTKPTPEYVQVIELCKSDFNKTLLLNNRAFLPYLVDALLIDPAHPRAGMKPELKAWCQATHCECVARYCFGS